MENTLKKSIWWLSFVGEEGFRGVVITEAPSFLSAVSNCNFNGINPYGEVAGFEIPEEEGLEELNPAHRDRLLLSDELRTLFEAKSVREWEAN